MIEALSILASAFELTGIYLLSVKNRFGFIINMMAGILWITYSAISHNAIGLFFVCSVGLVINFKGFRNWGRKL